MKSKKLNTIYELLELIFIFEDSYRQNHHEVRRDDRSHNGDAWMKFSVDVYICLCDVWLGIIIDDFRDSMLLESLLSSLSTLVMIYISV